MTTEESRYLELEGEFHDFDVARPPSDGVGSSVGRKMLPLLLVVGFRDRSLSCRGFVLFSYRLLNVCCKVDVAATAAGCCCLRVAFYTDVVVVTLAAAGDVFLFVCWLMLLFFDGVFLFGNLQHIGQVCWHLLNSRVVVFLNVCQHSLVSFSNKINSNSLTTETSTSTDSMNVVFPQRRQIVVDN